MAFAGQRILTLAAVIFLLSFAAEIRAAMYACKDSKGSIRFTNAPATGGCEKYRLKGQNSNSWPVSRSSNSSAYDSYIWAVGTRYNVDPYLIKAVIRAESSFNSRAVSSKGAQGLMQLMPATARELRVRDPFNPRDNIDGGTRYLRRMLDTFGGNLELSIAAYNAGPGAVKRANGVPRIPETIRYVTRVLKHYRGYRNEGEGIAQHTPAS